MPGRYPLCGCCDGFTVVFGQVAPAPQKLEPMGLSTLDRLGQIMVLQHLFMEPPDHTHFAQYAPSRLRHIG
jgi:hypothetical protein